MPYSTNTFVLYMCEVTLSGQLATLTLPLLRQCSGPELCIEIVKGGTDTKYVGHSTDLVLLLSRLVLLVLACPLF